MVNGTEEVIGVVSPRSVGGTSLFETPAPITAENVDEFRSEQSDIAATSNELRRLGFLVLQESTTTISFSGPRRLFQDAFNVELQRETMEVTGGTEVEFFAPPEEPLQRVLEAPGDLSNLTEGAAIARPAELYESALPPLAAIHPSAYRYLFVPDEVAVILRATRTHRAATITGLNVVVAMVDTGHYSHPFFNQHGYRILSTLLGPGASDPAVDTNGHGTGESANIFAAAPDARLLPVKMAVDPTGAFNAAVNASPKPQVITNSWGYDIDHPNESLPPALKPLEAAVANAVANGIVVCFAAGNGQRAWPGSHPDVISVGGVHVNYPDLTLEASSYASSFDSTFYPGRHSPDLCGLTGRRVTIDGAIRAPSLMLPVQPGSSLDGITPSTGANNDGWGLFSGTSAACPQVAGVVALILAKNPTLKPADVKKRLVDSARDVTTGTSAMGQAAGPGPDAATGAGLVDAKWAWLATMGDVTAQFFAASPEEREEMVANGQMPRVTPETVADLMDTLRSR
jgi:subtilisin family serine protease